MMDCPFDKFGVPANAPANAPAKYRAAIALAALMLFGSAYSESLPRKLVLDSGPVLAETTGDLLVLKGVPYAAPPVGDLRWQPPQPVEAWQKPRPANDFGASCPQRKTPRFVVPGTVAAGMNEDCLFLNAWAPANPVNSAKAAPVVVWIHGGGNVEGTASQTFYDGAAFARDGIVFVSFNYRLGLLGFFAHPGLNPKAGQQYANFALMDQIAALQWVRRNIRALGGDPENVTVMGESAGGEDILNLMSIPAAQGLFARAIVESAAVGWRDAPTLEQAQEEGARIAAELHAGGPDIDAVAAAAALRKTSVETLLGAQVDREIGPIVDRSLLNASVLKVFAEGKAAPIPLLIGTNDDEGSLLGSFAKPAMLFPRLSATDLTGLRDAYGAPAADDRLFARLLFRDGYFASTTRWVAGRQSRTAPVFLYRFDYVASLLRGRRPGASHGSEIPFVFQTGQISRASDDDMRIGKMLHGCWAGFIKTGVPNCSDASWPRYDPARDEILLFSAQPAVVKTPGADILDRLAARLEH